MEASEIAISFPIEVNSIKMSSKIVHSEFFEVIDELGEFSSGPFPEWE